MFHWIKWKNVKEQENSASTAANSITADFGRDDYLLA